MKTTTKTFGRYEVRIKKNKVSIYYVWSEKEKEPFKTDITPYEALVNFRDCYSHKGSRFYAEAKEFLLPYIEKEF